MEGAQRHNDIIWEVLNGWTIDPLINPAITIIQ